MRKLTVHTHTRWDMYIGLSLPKTHSYAYAGTLRCQQSSTNKKCLFFSFFCKSVSWFLLRVLSRAGLNIGALVCHYCHQECDDLFWLLVEGGKKLWSEGLFVVSQNGTVTQYLLEPRPRAGATEKVNEDMALDLGVTGQLQWTLNRLVIGVFRRQCQIFWHCTSRFAFYMLLTFSKA